MRRILNLDQPPPMSFSDDFKGAVRYWLPNPAWSTAGGVAVCTPLIKSVVSVTNPGFETGDPPTGWNASGATLSSVADARPGSGGTKAINILSSTNYGNAYQTFNLTANEWYCLSGYIKTVSGSGSLQLAYNFNPYAAFASVSSTSAEWGDKRI